MNKKKLAESIGQKRRLRPHLILFLGTPKTDPRLRPRRYFDEDWIVVGFEDDQLILSQPNTGFQMSLPTDSIREYRRNLGGADFLILKSQIILVDNEIQLEPLPAPDWLTSSAMFVVEGVASAHNLLENQVTIPSSPKEVEFQAVGRSQHPESYLTICAK